ncbi:hypothetical protein LTR05_006657 [Lithohypha guttulata]|uniref:Uncharacterized protein n=1 Tax=Lithohypha guttulata TaxID=1690604 RepID=A0AAN7SW43_9EURO|nr:hypothetical protein LTR05_006657 [Lithohypha guttulata]
MPYKQPQRIDQNPLLPSAHWGKRSQPQRGSGHHQDRQPFQQGPATERDRSEQQRQPGVQEEASTRTRSTHEPDDLDLGPPMLPIDIEESGSMIWSEERHCWEPVLEPEEVVDDENTGTRIGHCGHECRRSAACPYNQPPSSLDRQRIPEGAEVEYTSLPRRIAETRPSSYAECPIDASRVEDNEDAYDGDCEDYRPCRHESRSPNAKEVDKCASPQVARLARMDGKAQDKTTAERMLKRHTEGVAERGRHQTPRDLLFNGGIARTSSVESPNFPPRALRVLMDDPDYGHLIAGRNAARYLHLRTRSDKLLYPLIEQMVEEIEGELLDLVDTFQARWHGELGFSYMESDLYPRASGDAMTSAEQAMVLRRDENARKELEQKVRSSMQNAGLDVSAARQPASAAKSSSSSIPPQELPDTFRRKPVSMSSSSQPVFTAPNVHSEVHADEAGGNCSRSGWPSQPQRLITNIEEIKVPQASRVRWADELGLESPYICSDPARKQAFLVRRVRDRADTLSSGTIRQECESEGVQNAGPSTLESRSHDSPARDASPRPEVKGRIDLSNFVTSARKRWF